MNTKHFLLQTSIVLAMVFTNSCGDSDAESFETDDFYFHGSDIFKVINESEHDITGVTIRTWNGTDSVSIEYDELIYKMGGSRSFAIPDEVLPPKPLMCVKAENRPKLDCIKFNAPSYTWDGRDLYITRLPHPLNMESL